MNVVRRNEKVTGPLDSLTEEAKMTRQIGSTSWTIAAAASRFGLAVALAALIAFSALGSPVQAAEAPAVQPAAGEKPSGPNDQIDLDAIREQLRRLGEAVRRALDDAARSVDPRPGGAPPKDGGLGGLAPRVGRGEVQDVYGPEGPTVRSVKALLNYRLVLLGNRRLAAGRVYERDKRVIAEVVTVKEGALVARYMINKKTGVWVPEG